MPYSIAGGGQFIASSVNAATSDYNDNNGFCNFYYAPMDQSVCPAPYIFSNPAAQLMQESPFAASPTLRSIASILYDMTLTNDKLELLNLQNELFEVMLSDGDDTDMIQYLENLNSDEGLMKLVTLYVGKDMGTEALQKLQLVTDIYNNTNRTAFKEFYAVLIDLLLQNRSLNQMTQTEKDLMETITYLNVEMSGNAYNIIKMVEEAPYFINCEKLSSCDEDSSLLGGKKAFGKTGEQAFLDAVEKMNAERALNNTNGISTVKKQFGTGLFLAPNPAQEFTVVTANMAKNSNQAYILLTDITGKVIKKIDLQRDKANYQIETGNFAKGFYHVCLYENGVQTDCKKLIIN